MLFFVHTQMSLSHLLPLKVNRKLARPCTQNEIQLGFAIECVHMTSRGVNKETAAMLEGEIFYWELNSIFMQIQPFVSLCKYGFWSHERTHSIGSSSVKIN